MDTYQCIKFISFFNISLLSLLSFDKYFIEFIKKSQLAEWQISTTVKLNNNKSKSKSSRIAEE